MQASNDWGEARPRHLVGLYVLCHRHVYGVEPGELAKSWAGAVAAAGRMVAREFGGELVRAVAFLRWLWVRERVQEQRRGPENSFRIGWRYQFVSAQPLTDYRVHLARSARSRSPVQAARR